MFHVEGHWDADGSQMIEAIRRGTGQPDIKVGTMPWWLMGLESAFVPLFRELLEMRYLWNAPIRMHLEGLEAVLGVEPHTPLEAAVRATLIGSGNLAKANGI